MACFLQNKPKPSEEGILDSSRVDDRRWNTGIAESELPCFGKRFAADNSDLVLRPESTAVSQCIQVRCDKSSDRERKAIFWSAVMKKVKQPRAKECAREPGLPSELHSRFEPFRRKPIGP